MFTSRAEFRLLLRIDNADVRLTAKGRALGLVSDERWSVFEERLARLARNRDVLARTFVRSTGGDTVSAAQQLRSPGVTAASLEAAGVPLERDPVRPDIDLTTLETMVKYEGYLRRQEAEVERSKREERRRIPAGFPFDGVPGLTREVVQRLEQVRPETLGQALRIPGMTPAAVSVLSAFVGRFARDGAAS